MIRHIRNRRMCALFAALLVVVLGGLPGCVTRPVSSGGASAPGRYAAGQQLLLANGARLTVPNGWQGQLETPGAAATSTWAFGGKVSSSRVSTGWRAPVMFTVYPGAHPHFADSMAAVQAKYAAALRGVSGMTLNGKPVPLSALRTTVHSGADASATMFTFAYNSEKSTVRAVWVFVQGTGGHPMLIYTAGDLPLESAQPTPTAQLAPSLLRLLRFTPPS